MDGRIMNAAVEQQAPMKYDLPQGFESDEEFVEWVRTTYEDDLAADDANRSAAMEDSEFLAGEQWDEKDLEYRKDLRLPSLTVNQLPSFVGTVIGNRRLNQTTVRVTPDSSGTRGIANLREGIIASILKNSVAKRALDKAFENQVTTGIGNFGVRLTYANNDVFDQNIEVYSIPHALAVVWDRTSIDPTGRDAKHAFVSETISTREYDTRWPDAKGGEIGGEVDKWSRDNGWITNTDKRVLTVWRMNEKTVTLAMFGDGSIRDITNVTPEELQAGLPGPDGQPVFVVLNPKTQEPMIRESPKLFAQRWVVSSHEILEGPYELPIDRLPIFRANGWEINVGTRRVRWGLVRLAKDAQRLFNFWRSVVAEKLLYAPKATVMGPQSAFEGRMEEWRQMHTKREPLVFNDETPVPPQFLPPPAPDTALLQQAAMALDDMRGVLNLHEASMGMEGNEVSAKAIIARQRIGEMGTIIYNDNMNDAVEELGKVINQLIPLAYDTPRIVKVTGADDKEEQAAINMGPENDVTLGQYGITLSTGPSYVTKRAEAAEAMMTFVNHQPQAVAVAADLIVEAQDWPNAHAIAARFKKALPPNLLEADELTPEQQQAAQKQGQVMEMQMMLQMQNQEADTASKKAAAIHSEAMADEAIARSIQARAQAAAALQNADTTQFKAIADHIDKERSRMVDMQKTEYADAQSRRQDETNRFATLVGAQGAADDRASRERTAQDATQSRERTATFSTVVGADTARQAAEQRANQPKPGAKESK